jgi:hypothetical protein
MSTLRLGSHGRDVRTLKHWLNVCMRLDPPLADDTRFDAQTDQAVRAFQLQKSLTPVDGIVGGMTWAALGKMMGARAWLGPDVSSALWNLIDDVREGPLHIRHDVFVSEYVKKYGPLRDDPLSGLSTLLRFIDRDREIADVRWAAYMLATVMHECARTWEPIEEYGRGEGRRYGRPVTITGPDGRPIERTYYGRGYVQLTWHENYENMSAALGMGDDLVLHPERVLEPDIAYKVMSYGMRHGTFTSVALSRYITGTRCDYVNARRIINGLDCAEAIADYAEAFEAMLRASLYLQPS